MSVSPHYKLIGTAGAAALAIGVFASPAFAAGTASVNYSCVSAAGTATPSATYSVATPPASMAAGQPLTTTATFTLDPTTTGLAMNFLGWDSFKGTITTNPSATRAGLALRFPKTKLGQGAGGSTVATGAGSTLAGTQVGSFSFLLGNLGLVKLTGFDASGNNLGSVFFPDGGANGRCINLDPSGTTPIKDGATTLTTTIVKDRTTTAVTAGYSARKNIATGKAKVSSHYTLRPTGKVKFILKRGTHTVAKTTTKLNKKAVAKAVFKGVKRPGKYKIVGKYLGNASLTRSSDVARFRVR